MHYHQILVDKKLPSPVLTYSSRNLLPRGAVVRVLLRDKLVLGVVLGVIEDKEYLAKLETIKEVSALTGFSVGDKQLRFLHNFERNTFNNLNVIFEAMVRPYVALGVRDHDKILTRYQESGSYEINPQTVTPEQFLISEGTREWLKNKHDNLPKRDAVEFIIDSDTLLRIMDIIRTNVYTYLYASIVSGSDTSLTSEQLFLFPENKYLELILGELKSSDIYREFLCEITEYIPGLTLNLLAYSGRPTKKSKDVTRTLLQLTPADIQKAKSNQSPRLTINLIFATRSGMFLPYTNLRQVTLLDEASSMYIQEQNSLYFDTRDLTFILARTHEVPLTYLSTLPSVRLYSHYPEHTRAQLLQDNESRSIGHIKMTAKDRRHDEHDLLSNELLTILGVREATQVHIDEVDEGQELIVSE